MSKEIYRWLILLVLILALALRLISLNQSLWLDEAITALAVKNNTPWQLITQFALGDTHPPLYYVFLDVWTSIFGYSEIALRLPSALFGLVTVFVLFKIGELVFGVRVGLFAALLLATNPLHIYYSQEARMYSLTTLLVSFIVFFFLKEKWVWFSIALLFLGMTDYMPLLVLVPIWGIFLMKHDQTTTTWKKFLFSHIPILFFGVLWFQTFLIQQQSTMSYLRSFPEWKTVLGSTSMKETILVWVKFLIGRINFESNIVYATIVVLSSIAPVILLARAGVVKYSWNIFILLLVPLLTIFSASFFVSGFSYFRLLFLVPIFLLLLASTTKNFLFLPLVCMVVTSNIIFSSMYLFNSKFWREDWRTLVSYVEQNLKVGEIVVMSYPEPFDGYEWYAKKFDQVQVFSRVNPSDYTAIYTLDYLMDLTDKEKDNYQRLKDLGFYETNVVSFRGVGQVRYWVKE